MRTNISTASLVIGIFISFASFTATCESLRVLPLSGDRGHFFLPDNSNRLQSLGRTVEVRPGAMPIASDEKRPLFAGAVMSSDHAVVDSSAVAYADSARLA